MPAPSSATATTTTTTATTRGAAREDRVPWTGVAAYVVVALGLAWLVALPLWTGGGPTDPRFRLLALAMMLTPTVAAVGVTLTLLRPAQPWRSLGLVPGVGWRRLVVLGLVGLLAPVLLSALVLLVAGGTGLAGVDWSLGAYAANLTASGTPLPPAVPPRTIALVTLAAVPLNALVSAVPVAAEEIGWRGFLLPRLLPLGTGPALLVSGVVWGAWHAPLVLLGYDYGRRDALGVLLMVGFCVLVGVGLGALRLRSGCVWPGAVAHGCVNTVAPAVLLVFSPEPARGVGLTLLGPTGWVVLAGLAVVLALTGALRRPAPGASNAEGAPTGPR